MSKFQIGDEIWVAKANPEKTWVTCPDCLGKRQLIVRLGDESEVAIDCTCCQHGYEGCKGSISTYIFQARTEKLIVRGMEQRPSEGELEVTYMVHVSPEGNCWQNIYEKDAFASEEEAKARAEKLVLEHEEQELRSIQTKTKHSRSWAWNATYHRREIKRAQEQIEYHSKKLTVCLEHRKK